MEKRYENEEMEIDLLELFYVLRSKILAILMCGIIFGGLAFGYAKYLVTPQYTSSSMMLVLTKETTLSSLADLQIGSQLTKDYSLLIIETGEVPTVRSDTSVTKTTAMGILLGMLLCAGVVVVRALMDDTIRSEEDIEKYLGLSTLSVIPDRKDYINGTGKKKSKK